MKILIVTTPENVVHRMGFAGADPTPAIAKIMADLPECTFEEIEVEDEE